MMLHKNERAAFGYDEVMTTRFDAILVTHDGRDGRGEASRAVALTSGGIRGCIPLDEAGRWIERTSGRPLILIDACGSDDRTLAASLARIDGLASGRGFPIIAAISEDQIDVAAAGLVAETTQLLCDPTVADWIGAIAVAMFETGTTMHDPRVGESERARLARLNDEVARIADVLSRLSRRDTPEPRAIADRRPSFAGEPGMASDIDAAVVRQVIRARRLRDRHFGNGIFEDPAWDMMLDLFAAHIEKAQVSVSSLCIAAAVAPTTALRWIGKMTQAGLFVRRPDPFDRRRAFMELAPGGVSAMRAYISMLQAQSLPLV